MKQPTGPLDSKPSSVTLHWPFSNRAIPTLMLLAEL